MDFEEIKKNAVAMFGNAIRKSPTAPKANAQHIALALAQLLDQVGEGQPVPLDPLYDFMKDQGYDDKSLQEVLFFFHARREMMNLNLELPQALLHIPDEQRNEIALNMARQTTDAYMAKRRPEPPPAGPIASDLPSYDKKKRKAGGGRRLVAMLSVLVLLSGVAVFVYFVKDDNAAAQVVLPEADNDAGCTKVIGAPPHGICYLSAESARRGDDELAAAVDATRRALADRGYTDMRFLTPDGKRL